MEGTAGITSGHCPGMFHGSWVAACATLMVITKPGFLLNATCTSNLTASRRLWLGVNLILESYLTESQNEIMISKIIRFMCEAAGTKFPLTPCSLYSPSPPIPIVWTNFLVLFYFFLPVHSPIFPSITLCFLPSFLPSSFCLQKCLI